MKHKLNNLITTQKTCTLKNFKLHFQKFTNIIKPKEINAKE